MIEILFLIFPLSVLFFLLVFAIWLAGIWWQAVRVTLKACSRYRLRSLFFWTTAIAAFLALVKNRAWLPEGVQDPIVLGIVYVAGFACVLLAILVVRDLRNHRICVSHDLQQRLARVPGVNAATSSSPSPKRPKLQLRSGQFRYWRPGGRIDV